MEEGIEGERSSGCWQWVAAGLTSWYSRTRLTFQIQIRRKGLACAVCWVGAKLLLELVWAIVRFPILLLRWLAIHCRATFADESDPFGVHSFAAELRGPDDAAAIAEHQGLGWRHALSAPLSWVAAIGRRFKAVLVNSSLESALYGLLIMLALIKMYFRTDDERFRAADSIRRRIACRIAAPRLQSAGVSVTTWTWLERVLLRELYDGNAAVVLGSNHAAARISLQQVRVRHEWCTAMPPGVNISQCLSKYDTQSASHTSFGFGGSSFEWADAASDKIAERSGVVQQYEANGFVEYLEPRIDDAKPRIEELARHGFIDEYSRLLAIDIVLLNPHTAVAVCVSYLLEYPATGGIFPSVQLHSLKLDEDSVMMSSRLDKALVLTLLPFVALHLYKMLCISDKPYSARAATHTPVIMYFAIVGARLFIGHHCRERTTAISQQAIARTAVAELRSVAWLCTQETSIDALSVPLLFCLSLRYMAMQPRFGRLLKQMQVPCRRIMAVLLLWLLMSLVFAAIGRLALGATRLEFASFAEAWTSVTRLSSRESGMSVTLFDESAPTLSVLFTSMLWLLSILWLGQLGRARFLSSFQELDGKDGALRSWDDFTHLFSLWFSRISAWLCIDTHAVAAANPVGNTMPQHDTSVRAELNDVAERLQAEQLARQADEHAAALAEEEQLAAAQEAAERMAAEREERKENERQYTAAWTDELLQRADGHLLPLAPPPQTRRGTTVVEMPEASAVADELQPLSDACDSMIRRLDRAAEFLQQSPTARVARYLDDISIRLEKLLAGEADAAERLRQHLEAGNLEDGRWLAMDADGRTLPGGLTFKIKS